MAIVLFDKKERRKLYPLNNCCAAAELRCGIFNAVERWALITEGKVYVHTADHLAPLYEPISSGTHTWVDASLLADKVLIEKILSLGEGSSIADEHGLIAAKININPAEFDEASFAGSSTNLMETVRRIEYPWQIFQYNDAALRADFELLTARKKSQALPANNNYLNPSQIFIEEGASVVFSSINASTGPVYIGRDSVIMEDSAIRGPFALCEGSVLKMGAKMYGATTIGPGCVVGGEVKNAVLQSYSNKGHDGYLGDAVIGRLCNLGAGTSNSNVKNNAGLVKMWNAFSGDYAHVDVKCGVIMGDYSKTAINSSINTGTVIGSCCNVFGEGLLPTYIKDFEWGTKRFSRYELDRAINDIANWKKMKGQILSNPEINVLKHIFEKF